MINSPQSARFGLEFTKMGPSASPLNFFAKSPRSLLWDCGVQTNAPNLDVKNPTHMQEFQPHRMDESHWLQEVPGSRSPLNPIMSPDSVADYFVFGVSLSELSELQLTCYFPDPRLEPNTIPIKLSNLGGMVDSPTSLILRCLRILGESIEF
ncbi:hypothetical protein C8R44DRAFT_755022 [Mycena epipterygia]|nr:hypothetical protein C8R44DRAFT_755022 [Mycena epipterygia]